MKHSGGPLENQTWQTELEDCSSLQIIKIIMWLNQCCPFSYLQYQHVSPPCLGVLVLTLWFVLHVHVVHGPFKEPKEKSQKERNWFIHLYTFKVLMPLTAFCYWLYIVCADLVVLYLQCSYLFAMIVWMRVVFRKTVAGDRRFGLPEQ